MLFPLPPVLRTMFPYTASRCVCITSQQRKTSKLCYPKLTAISLDMYTKSHLKTRDQKVVLWVKNTQLQKCRPKSVVLILEYETNLAPLCIVSLVLPDNNKILVVSFNKEKKKKQQKINKKAPTHKNNQTKAYRTCKTPPCSPCTLPACGMYCDHGSKSVLANSLLVKARCLNTKIHYHL